MEIVGYREARQRLAKLIDTVGDDRRPVVITRQKAPSVVMPGRADYASIAETRYLLRSPRGARRLHKAVRDADAGRFVTKPRR